MASSPALRTSSLLSSSRFSSSMEKRNTKTPMLHLCLLNNTHFKTIGLDSLSFTRIDLVEGIRVQTFSCQFEYGGHRTTGKKPGHPSVIFQSWQQHWTQLLQQTQQLHSTINWVSSYKSFLMLSTFRKITPPWMNVFKLAPHNNGHNSSDMEGNSCQNLANIIHEFCKYVVFQT